MRSLQERAVDLINQSPSARAARDIEMVLPWLQKRSKLLMELDRDTLRDIARHCSYEKATKDDVIIQQGDKGDKFYVIMTGHTSVYIVTTSDDDTTTSPGTSESQNVTSPRGKTVRQDKDDDRQQVTSSKPAMKDEEENDHAKSEETSELDRSQFGKFIMFYKSGDCFGEIALLFADAVRNATIIADVDTDLLVIDRTLFNRSVKAKEEEDYRERKEFVDNHPLFASWSDKLRRLLEMSLTKEVHPYGSDIMKQGQPSTGLVFILSGQARMCMEPGRHETQYQALLKPPIDTLIKTSKKCAVRERTRSPRGRKTQVQIEVRRREGYAAAERRVQGRTVDLCCVEKNEIVGDTEMALELDTNLATIVSTANTQVFVFNAKNYERLVAKKNPHTVRLLLHNVCQKLSARVHSAKVSQLPLLPRLHQAAMALQKRIGFAADDISHHHRQNKGHNKQDKNGHSSLEKRLVRMFLQGRVPLIKPCVPDSLYFRETSAAKTKALLSRPYAKLRTLSMLQNFTTLRRKVPRSIQQLKGNAKAEHDLLGHAQEEEPTVEELLPLEYDVYSTSHVTTEVPAKPTGARRRPFSAAPAGFSPGPRPFTSSRPRSAVDLRIVQCRDEDADPWGGWAGSAGGGGAEEDEVDTLDQHTVSEIFDHMDAVQRDKSESRLRVFCTNTARSELRTNLERERTLSHSNSYQGYDELYEDAFFDWETSDNNLRDLESRVASFCSPQSRTDNGLRPSSSSRSKRPSSSSRSQRPSVSQMKRFEIEDPNSIPLPGGTVFVHQKPCRYTPATPISGSANSQHHGVVVSSSVAAPHTHVRRFMLQRDRPVNLLAGS